VTFLVIALGSGAAQYMGAGRQDMVNHVLMVVITSLLFGTIGYLSAPYLLELLGVAQDVYAVALGFLRVSFVGILLVFTYAMFQALMRGRAVS
jgi:Na+-driven multidrug efflux pump